MIIDFNCFNIDYFLFIFVWELLFMNYIFVYLFYFLVSKNGSGNVICFYKLYKVFIMWSNLNLNIYYVFFFRIGFDVLVVNILLGERILFIKKIK